MAEQTWEGGCLCGAVRYRAEGEPLLSEYCHCGMCRRAAGAPVIVWADFPRERYALLRGQPAHFVSSPGARRGFCAQCGSTLTFSFDGRPYLSLTVATLDEPERLAPRQHIFEADRLSWLQLGDDLPRHRQQAPPRQ